MRQLATLPNADAARTLADYLLTLRIETRVDSEADGWLVWVLDEDRLPEARQALSEFQAEPRSERFRAASRAADILRRQDAAAPKEDATSAESSREPPAPPFPRWTLALTLMCLAVAVLTNFGGYGIDVLRRDPTALQQPIIVALSIASFRIERIDGKDMIGWDNLDDILHGQVWRLVTPIFLHFGVVHLLFNVMMLRSLGVPIELQRGPWRFLGLVLMIAVGSNLAQYYLGGTRWTDEGFLLEPRPVFGGMSGVLYGLFGYIWIKGRLEPELGLEAPPQLIFVMLAWFALCLTGMVGPIANYAHAGGLAIGLLIGGFSPLMRRWLRQR
jgi:GlpG protein